MVKPDADDSRRPPKKKNGSYLDSFHEKLARLGNHRADLDNQPEQLAVRKRLQHLDQLEMLRHAPLEHRRLAGRNDEWLRKKEAE